MNSDKILEIVHKHNLSIRRIPNEVISLWSALNAKEDDVIVEKNGRKFIKTVKIPEHAGFYMVKEVNSNASMVRWNLKTDFLSDTLEGSIKLFLESKDNEN